jgi:hypothetical protein
MNVPFALLAARFEYPDVLRSGSEHVLVEFAKGGDGLVLLWLAYALVALGFVPLAFLVGEVSSAAGSRAARFAVHVGVAAGLAQAIGLLRWVFVVPGLAREFVDPTATTERRAAIIAVQDALHQMIGTGLGEFIGQGATALWTALVAVSIVRGRTTERALAALGLAIAACLVLGLADPLGTVSVVELPWAAAATPVGYVAWSLWLAALGFNLLHDPESLDRARRARAVSDPSNA